MLTASELAWLKRRQFFNGFYTTSGCLTCSLNETLCDKTDCLLHPDLEDALEFSERVAVKLTIMPRRDGPCDYGQMALCSRDCGSHWLNCRDARLKWARLTVEEEMDG